MAIWGAATGVGPFVRPHLRDSLLALQTFVSMMTATFLVLAAAIEERRAAVREARQARAAAENANRAKAEFREFLFLVRSQRADATELYPDR